MSADIILRDDGPQNPSIYGSLPTDPRKRLRAVSQHTQGDCFAGDDAIDRPIDVVGWLVHPVEMADEHTGEYVTHSRLVLWDADGLRVSTLSPSCLQAWRLVVDSLGSGPYDPPLAVVIRESKSRKGNKYRTIVVLDDDTETVI